ncbi:MAG: phosphatidylglycerol lysyltransferase domain-containing protein [Bacteroidales bacterium]|jgi:hypothetical protein|nr:phosphatidylglycerol lysyltransferase domain-containing protein [Bacteroidales bacterium]
MMDFKTVEITDKQVIDKYITGNMYRGCDFCFANMFAWQPLYRTCFAEYGETLFIRNRDSSGAFFYLMPLGKMPLHDALNLLTDDARHQNIPFTMKNITQPMCAEIEQAMPDKFDFRRHRENDEYIYLSENLISLAGGKLHGKRNHVNRFKFLYPDWEYHPLTTEAQLLSCARMTDEWEHQNDEITDSLRYDYIAITLMLRNFHALNLHGGYITAEGKTVAFSIGEPLTDDTFVVHAEKALNSFDGAYSIINQQFAEHEAARFRYINREEDMGLENLRKAKLSYHPEFMLEEYTVTEKSTP